MVLASGLEWRERDRKCGHLAETVDFLDFDLVVLVIGWVGGVNMDRAVSVREQLPRSRTSKPSPRLIIEDDSSDDLTRDRSPVPHVVICEGRVERYGRLFIFTSRSRGSEDKSGRDPPLMLGQWEKVSFDRW